jgi:hypothetical protein
VTAKRAETIAPTPNCIENDPKAEHRNPYPESDYDSDNASSTACVSQKLRSRKLCLLSADQERADRKAEQRERDHWN